MDFDAIKREAIGRWPIIFSHLGVEVGNGKHKACPVCGGKDRFRFDDKDGRGTWFCNQCGAGDGIKLVCNFLGANYPEAMRRIGHAVGYTGNYTRKIQPVTDIETKRRRLIQLWNSSEKCTGVDPVSKYLQSRGLIMTVNDVQYCPRCYEAETKSHMPAMVAKVRNLQGKPVSIHRTYLSGTGKAPIKSPKKLMTGTEPLAGCSVRLFRAKETLGVAEGIETAIAAMQLTGIPTWAAVSNTLIESFQPPNGIRHVVVFGDCDPNYTGQASAYKLAKRLFLEGYIVEVKIPDRGDWADQIELKDNIKK